MSGRESAAMAHARELITTGPRKKRMSATEAAEVAGVHRRSIYRARWYKDYMAAEYLRAQAQEQSK